MAFEPDKITKDLIQKAVEKIENENIQLKPSTGYDVIINNKAYPPKEILRYAHELLNGERIWFPGGGEPTNKYLKRLGYEIITKYASDQSELELTGNVWKLGSKWGANAPSFYDFIKDESIVIGVKNNYVVGDLILICEGYTVKAIARVNESLVSVTNNSKFEKTFRELEIEYEDWVNYADAEWYELNEAERLSYETRQGIVKVNRSHPVYKLALDRWNNRNNANQLSLTKQMKMQAKNIILYGPPGTGKTYNSIEKAVELATGKSFSGHPEYKKQFDELRKQGQIEFVTFHQNYSYEDFVVGISPDVTAGTLRFDKKEGIFKQLSERAKQNWLSATNKKEITIDFNFVFNSFFSKLIEEEIEEIEVPMRSRGYKFKITSIDIDDGRIKFTKQSGGTGHDLLVKNLKAIYEGVLDYGAEGLGVYYYPLVDHLKEYANNIEPQKETGEELKNFVLIIDEINRANISKVFGELITLLEDDKRLGEPNELKVALPNGEKDFGVPPNLYIIGTMNTADKSIALVDIALRRRFEFIGYYPKYEGYDFDAGTLLKKINETIYKEKKSADYLIGHAYFMKEQSIEVILKNKILPLLMEYFSGKTDIVTRVFAETSWNVLYDTTNFNWNISKR